jgi:hypothetical protein
MDKYLKENSSFYILKSESNQINEKPFLLQLKSESSFTEEYLFPRLMKFSVKWSFHLVEETTQK